MNFIEAAVEILRAQPDKPMHVDELCRLAVERKLLSRPAKDPVRSMKGRLTTEAKKGDASRVVNVGDGVWQLRAPGIGQLLAPQQQPQRGLAPPGDEEGEIAEMWGTELEPTPLAGAHEEFRDEHTDDEDRPMLPEIVAPRHERFGRTRGDRRAKRDASRHRKRAKEAGAEVADEQRDKRRGGRSGRGERRTREEKRKEPQRDEKRKEPQRDEKRKEPQREEKRKEPQRDEKRKESPRDEKRKESQRDEKRKEPQRDEVAVAPARSPQPGPDRNPLADAAEQALAQLKDGQSVQVRQLAQMMRKRKLLIEDPDQTWRVLKAALLADERSHLEHGLRPRIVYRGRGLFAAAERGRDDEVAAAEAALARATADLAAATRRALGQRLCTLPLRNLESVVHIYLLRAGWHSVAWIKRVEGSTSYALGQRREGSGKVLIGVHAGSDAVPRRGVGELRAGVEAKGLDAGMLIAPQPLSDEAGAELAKGGRHLTVLCGDEMVLSLVQAGIGVVAAHAPLRYLDAEFFRELTAG